MIRFDNNALICDLAETYNIYNYKEIAASQVAIFAIGLQDNSRIKMKLAKQKIDSNTLLQAMIVDELRTLVWFKTDDARKGINRPKSIVGLLYNEKPEISGFATGKDFENARARILSGKE